MMNREEFHRNFKVSGPAVTPVVHVVDDEQITRNLEIIIGEGAQGVFLINHDFGVDEFLPLIRNVRDRFPNLWIGLNFLAVTGLKAFPILGQLQSEGCPIDAYWADDARIDERRSPNDQEEAVSITSARLNSDWNGLYFGGTCFKKQRDVPPEHYGLSASLAADHMDVVTTSGIATGQEADGSKIEVFREAIGNKPMALASGITPENVETYHEVDCFLVATGINFKGDFYNIDPARLRKLINVTKTMGGGKIHG
jgi:uncharacterized protein